MARKKVKLGTACFLVGVTQLTVVIFNLCEKIWQFITDEEPFTAWRRVYITISNVVEVVTGLLYNILRFKVLVGTSIYEKIWELLFVEEPVEVWQHVYTVVTFSVEILLTYLLLSSSYTGNIVGAMVWLVAITPFFCAATTYTVFYSIPPPQKMLDSVVVVIIWLSWYTVLRFCIENRPKKRGRKCNPTMEWNGGPLVIGNEFT